MSGSRRDFLKSSGLVVMAGAAGFMGTESYLRGADLSGQIQFNPGQGPTTPANSGKADRPQPSTLVTIFLRGGADMLNTIVPFGDDLYYKVRPRIALSPKGGKGGEAGCIPMKGDKYWGINAAMASLSPLIDKGMCVPIVNVGSTDGTRSHFSAQDYMERGAPGDTLVTSGWLNRYLEATKKSTDAPLRGLSAQTLVPRALRGPYPVLAGNNRTEQMALFEELYSQQNMVNMNAREGMTVDKGSRLEMPSKSSRPAAARALTSDETRDIITQSGANAIERIKALESAQNMMTEASYPAGGLSHQLMAIAKVIKANVGLEVAQADIGGWDTHSDEGGANGGRMAGLVRNLSDSIVAFTQDLGSRMDKVTILVMSEFGRTVHENGAQGTDHGRAGYMLAIGNAVKGGQFYGQWKGLGDLDGGRFLPVHTDFRAVFAESLVKMFNIDPFALQIFPGYKPAASAYLNYLNAVKQA